MLAVLLTISAMFVQGVPVPANQGGTVTGILRTATGAPAAGVRVSALARPEAIKDLVSLTAVAGLTETDAAGRYRLENVPPGHYYIIAGRVDTPTFYPGTVQPGEGIIVIVTAGLTLSGIDFAISNASVGRADAAFAGVASWVIPVETRVDNGGKVPLFADGRFPILRFTRAGSTVLEAPLDAANVTLLFTSVTGVLNGASPTADYNVSVENLPNGYDVKALKFGAVDLKTNALQLSVTRTAAASSQSISLILAPPPSEPTAGVRVAGRIPGNAKRAIYISGKPGTIYSDGTFEFVGVPPGLHTILTLNNPNGEHTLGAGLVVGDRDLLNIELEELGMAPSAADRPIAPSSAGNRVPGSRTRPAAIRGRIVDGETHEPLNAGRVIVNGDYLTMSPLNEEGRFEISRLLPGTYDVEVVAFGVGVVSRTVVLNDQDATLELTIAP